MKNRKKWLLLTVLALLFTCTVGGTLAYLIDATESVENTFTPVTHDHELEESFTDNKKSDVKVTNKGDLPIYVRVALVGNWVLKGEIVAPWDDSAIGTDQFSDKWDDGNDGYWYYKTPLQPNATTEPLFSGSYTVSSADAPIEGAKLVLDVISQSIQATPTEAVKDAWKVTVDADGNISK